MKTTRQQSRRPGNPETAATISLAAGNSVTGTSDSPRTTLAWLHDLVGLSSATVHVGLAVSRHASVRKPFPIDVDKLAEATGYARSTVVNSIAALIRQGRLERVRRALPDDCVFVRQYRHGALFRWVPRPALYRLTSPPGSVVPARPTRATPS